MIYKKYDKLNCVNKGFSDVALINTVGTICGGKPSFITAVYCTVDTKYLTSQSAKKKLDHFLNYMQEVVL